MAINSKLTIMKIKSLKFIGILVLTLLLSNCNLGLQEEFDFVPDANTDNPFENMTALEWIESRSPGLLSTGRYNVTEFDYLLAAIKKAGRGDVVTISEIKVKYVGINQPAKNVSPCTFEVQ